MSQLSQQRRMASDISVISSRAPRKMRPATAVLPLDAWASSAAHRALMFLFATFVLQIPPTLCFSPPLYHHPKRAFRGPGPLRLQQIAVDANTVLSDVMQSQVSTLVTQRAEARWEGNYTAADSLRDEIDVINSDSIPVGFSVVMEDVPRGQGGGSTWKLVYTLAAAAADDSATNTPTDTASKPPSVLNLAHAALGLVISSSERNVPVQSQQLLPLVQQAKEQLTQWNRMHNEISAGKSNENVTTEQGTLSPDGLRLLTNTSTESVKKVASWNTIEVELRGRKAADAAFWFALAGVDDSALFDLLVRVCTKELNRFGHRPSCRLKDVVGIVQRLAAAGVRQDAALLDVVGQCLNAKAATEDAPVSMDTANMLDLHSDHCALVIWKFSTKQRKQRAFLLTAAKHWDERHNNADSPATISPVDAASNLLEEQQPWDARFTDRTKKLVVDVGCGMGMSVLGLASLNATDDDDTTSDYDWSSYNYVGVDLSRTGIGYAKGIIQRWDLSDRAAFVVDAAESFLGRLKDYPGPIELVMLQFPTPYRLVLPPDEDSTDDSVSKGGNSQLPTSVADGFMVTPGLLKLAADLLKRSDASPSGKLMLQSNCEDVAVWMRETALKETGLHTASATSPLETLQGTPTKRTLNWIAMGGARAQGTGWSSEPLLPRRGRTETEIACILNETPVHRCVLVHPS